MYAALTVRRGIRRAFAQMHLPLTRSMLKWLMREIEEQHAMAFGPPEGATAAPPAFDLVNLVNRMVAFDYVNHRGEDRRRLVTFTSLHYGTIEGYYPEPTFLFTGWDHDQRAVRAFDLRKMLNVEVL